MLQDVFDLFAKKINILLDVKDLSPNFIESLSKVFQANKGDNPVTFDVLELEKVVVEKPALSAVNSGQQIAEPILFETRLQDIDDEDEVVFTEILPDDAEPIIIEPIIENQIEETKTITRLWMQSRKLKIKISHELLSELEKLQVNFKLN